LSGIIAVCDTYQQNVLPCNALKSYLGSNKGAAWLSTDNSPVDSIDGAVSMLCAALLNCYGNGRAWVRVAHFLELQGREVDATLFLEDTVRVIEGLQMLPFIANDTETLPPALKILKSELIRRQKRVQSRSRVKKINLDSTEEQLNQRIAIDRKSGRTMAALEEEIRTCEGLYNMHTMMTMIVDGAKGDEIKRMIGPTKDRDLQNYANDFLQSVGVPDGLDKSSVYNILYWSFVTDRTHPWFRAMGWRMAWTEKEGSSRELRNVLTDKNDIFKRWHGTYPLQIISQDPIKYAKVRNSDFRIA
jgi:hypothetical protein